MIDAHQHFWKLDLPFNYGWLHTPQHERICRSYVPSDLQPHLEKCGIQQSVFVQTQHDLAENRWALTLAEKNDFIAGVVGWIDLTSEDCEKQLEEFQSHRKFVGVRHIVQDEPDDNFIVRPDVIRGLKVLQKYNVPYDLLFYTKHLKHAATLGQQLPELRMVIDHLSKPRIKDQVTKGWREDIYAAARYPNIYCKISGMVTEADWTNWKPSDLKPYVDTVLDAFGPQRCMYGSDWPVCELAGTYEQIYNALAETLEQISDSERQQIYESTAASFYGLPPLA